MTEVNIIQNIFSKDERKDLLEKSKPLLRDSRYYSTDGQTAEGFEWFRLTGASMYTYPYLKFYHDRITKLIREKIGLNLAIMGSWMNLTDGRRKEIKWHNHAGFDYTGVYYLKTVPFLNSGTLIKDYGFVRSPQNSLLILPANIDHTSPAFPFRFKRYTYAFNLNIITRGWN